MLSQCIVVTTKADAGQCLFDFFSIGHIAFGLATFLILSLFYVIPYTSKKDNKVWMPLWLCYVFSIVVLIGWEFLENILLFEWGFKFEDKQDSLLNASSDIIIGIIFATVNYVACKRIINKDRNKWAYYIPGIIAFIIWFGVFFILRYVTYNNLG